MRAWFLMGPGMSRATLRELFSGKRASLLKLGISGGIVITRPSSLKHLQIKDSVNDVVGVGSSFDCTLCALSRADLEGIALASRRSSSYKISRASRLLESWHAREHLGFFHGCSEVWSSNGGTGRASFKGSGSSCVS
ncbi:hypothetical protein D3C72_2041500 [compost metagenome]